MKKLLFTFFIISLLITPLLGVNASSSSGYEEGVIKDRFDTLQGEVTGNSGFAADPKYIVVDIIKIALGFLGIIFVVLIIISGFQWMTAGGNSEQVTAARKRLINAVIGLFIILAAYVITQYVIINIFLATRN